MDRPGSFRKYQVAAFHTRAQPGKELGVCLAGEQNWSFTEPHAPFLGGGCGARSLRYPTDNLHRSSSRYERNKQLCRHHKLRGATTQSHLFRVETEGEGQDAFCFDWSVIEDRRFEDPLTRRLYSRASKREMAADGFSLHNKPYY